MLFRESARTQTLLNGFNLEVIRENTHKSMIHINVADTQTLVEKSDGVTKYTAYNIYVNGSFHAAVRFSRLIQFAEAIKQRFATKNHLMLRFPSKQWFPLDEKGIEQRRIKISKYFNLLAQSPDIVRSLFVERCFLEFQIESYPETSTNISLNVFLGDGYKIGMKCALSLCTDDVMKVVFSPRTPFCSLNILAFQKIAQQLQIDNSERFLQMFGMFLARPRDDSNNLVDGQFNMLVVRLLRNFESPYATLQTANRQSAVHGVCYKLVIRKMIWDPRVEETLLCDAAKSDLQNGFFSTSSESIAEHLRILEAKDDKLQYLRICHQFPSYSYEVFPHCIGDYPEPNTPCEVMIGRRQLVLVISGKEVCESSLMLVYVGVFVSRRIDLLIALLL
ncbi:unnamed protein product [Angiostrongylus costaricensis]|uniref:PX domain-containing protein n=1 Tax=Angiostrongylus costaricensis TaxID=334426 RepID=A0A158PF22_ANGCS|nr:unnamed protein product [Angiostrongylus costaricensis]